MIKKIILTIGFLFTATIYGQSPNINIEHWQTKNGAQVYFVRSPQIPMVDVRVVFAAGSSYDEKAWGLASLTNSLLSEGTTQHTADQISAAFDSVGAQFSQGVDQDMAELKLRSLTMSKYLMPALQIFTETLSQPNFPNEVLQRIKQQTLSNIQINEQSPNTIAAEAFFRLVYKDHPYAHPTEGTTESVSVLTQEDVKKFYHQFYVAKNADLIIVGNVSREQAEKIAQQVVGQLPSGDLALPIALATNTSQSAYQYIPFPAKQDTVVIGDVGINPQDSRRFPLLVGNEIVGGEPLDSLLFNEVRNKRGLAYQVSSEFSALKYRGPFTIELQSRGSQAKSALQVATQVLENFIQQGPTDVQLEEAKRNMIGSFPLRISSNSRILDAVTAIAFYGLPMDYLKTYPERVRNVTAAQVKEAFQQVVNPSTLKTVVVGRADPTSTAQLSHHDDE